MPKENTLPLNPQNYLDYMVKRYINNDGATLLHKEPRWALLRYEHYRYPSYSLADTLPPSILKDVLTVIGGEERFQDGRLMGYEYHILYLDENDRLLYIGI